MAPLTTLLIVVPSRTMATSATLSPLPMAVNSGCKVTLALLVNGATNSMRVKLLAMASTEAVTVAILAVSCLI